MEVKRGNPDSWMVLLTEMQRRYDYLKSINVGKIKLSDGKEFDLSLDKSIEMYEKLIKELITYQIEDAKI